MGFPSLSSRDCFQVKFGLEGFEPAANKSTGWNVFCPYGCWNNLIQSHILPTKIVDQRVVDYDMPAANSPQIFGICVSGVVSPLTLIRLLHDHCLVQAAEDVVEALTYLSQKATYVDDVVHSDMLHVHAHKPGKQMGQMLTTPTYILNSELDMDNEYHVGDVLEVDSI